MDRAHNKSVSAPITTNQTVSEVFATLLRHNFDYMLDWVNVAYEGKDIEGVHQTRVALRRMRSALVLFRKAIPRPITDPWAVEMRWIASEMGPARDLDVFIHEGLEQFAGKIPLRDGEKKLTILAQEHQTAAYGRVRTLFDGDRFKRFAQTFDTWLTLYGWTQEDLHPSIRTKLNKEITPYARKILTSRATKVSRTGERQSKMSIDELHQLRIEGKKLRYAVDFFSPLFEADTMAVFKSHLKSLQGLLGTMNDVSIMPDLIAKLLNGRQDPEINQYAGAAIGWRAREYEEIRGELDHRWNQFANTPFPWVDGPG